MCLPQAKIEELLRQEAASDGLREFREHARGCAECRKRADRAAERILVEQVTLAEGHLDPVVLSEYLDNKISKAERLIVEIHLQACDSCRRLRKTVQAAHQQAERVAAVPGAVELHYRPAPDPLPLPQGWFAGQMEALKRAPFPALFHSLQAAHSPAPVRSSRKPAQRLYQPRRLRAWGVPLAAVAAIVLFWLKPGAPYDGIRDGELIISPASGTLEVKGLPTGPEGQEEQALLRSKLPGSRQPVLLAKLSSPTLPLVTRGAPTKKATPPTILNPLPGEALLAPTVTVEWQKLPHITNYKITIQKVGDAQPLFNDPETNETSMTLKDLKPGTYTVVVERSDATVLARPVEFRVLSQSEAAGIEQKVQEYGTSHLLKGIFYEKKHPFSRALAEYRALDAENPHAPLAHTIYQSFQQYIDHLRERA